MDPDIRFYMKLGQRERVFSSVKYRQEVALGRLVCFLEIGNGVAVSITFHLQAGPSSSRVSCLWPGEWADPEFPQLVLLQSTESHSPETEPPLPYQSCEAACTCPY